MASASPQLGPVFPDGTSVGAYLASGQVGSAPLGSALDTQTVAGGSATFTGLSAGGFYVAWGQVSGVWRRVSFSIDAATDVAAHASDDTTVTGLWTFDTDPVFNEGAIAAAIGDGELSRDQQDASLLADYELLFSQWKTLFGWRAAELYDAHAAGEYVFALNAAITAATNGASLAPFDFDPADYPGGDRDLKLRIKGAVLANAIAPGTTSYRLGLKAATSSGGNDVGGLTLGSLVTGSQPTAVSDPVAYSRAAHIGAQFDAPAEGLYVPTVTVTGTIADLSVVTVLFCIQYRHV